MRWRWRYFRSWLRWVIYGDAAEWSLSFKLGRWWSVEFCLWPSCGLSTPAPRLRSEPWGFGLWRYSWIGRRSMLAVWHVLDAEVANDALPF